MVKITDKDLTSMSLEDLRSLSKRIKVAEKTQQLNANKEVASTLNLGDKIEFTLPKSTTVQTGIIAKVKRVMIAIKAVDNSAQWNVPLTSVVKVVSKATKSTKPSTKASTTSKKAKPATTTSKKTKPVAKVTKPTTKPKTKPSTSGASIIKALREKAAAKKTTSTPIVASDVTPEASE